MLKERLMPQREPDHPVRGCGNAEAQDGVIRVQEYSASVGLLCVRIRNQSSLQKQ